MSRKLFTAPLKNITNKQASCKQEILSDIEREVLASHVFADENQICAMNKYSRQISNYYESLDVPSQFIEADITFEMRSLLVDWMISCHEKVNLSDDTLYFSIFLTDRFLTGRSISPNKLQLVGITALFIASKYEEVVCPDLNSFIILAERNYSEAEITKAEKYMLYSLNYDVRFLNPLYFVRRVSKANNYDSRTRKMAKYFLELMTLSKVFYDFPKSVLGTTAMYLARKICQTDVNKNIFFLYSNLDRCEIKRCFDELVKLIYSDPAYPFVEKKYSQESRYSVNILARKFARDHFN